MRGIMHVEQENSHEMSVWYWEQDSQRRGSAFEYALELRSRTYINNGIINEQLIV